MEPYGGKRVREKKREGNDYVADLDEKNLRRRKGFEGIRSQALMMNFEYQIRDTISIIISSPFLNINTITEIL